jgi:flagellar motor switch protein FliM
MEDQETQLEGAEDGTEAMAAEWQKMSEDSDGAAIGADRVLDQNEIDNLLGFNFDDSAAEQSSGIRALIDSARVSYERLPMLEIVFDRLVRLATTSLRNFTSDNVEVSLESISSVRFGDYLNSIPLPAILGVFRAEEWDNFGILTVDSDLIYSIIDVLLGGGRNNASLRVEGRPYTTIETSLVRRLIEIILADAERAFQPLSPVKLNLDRLESNPRFAAISRPANAAILIELRVDMEDRGGVAEIMLPLATIEPIRNLLLQQFMGEKFGRDPIWEGHLSESVYHSEVELDAVLYEGNVPLRQVMDLKIGQTLVFETGPDDPVRLKCENIDMTTGLIGRKDDHISVEVNRGLFKPKTTFAEFEKAAQSDMEGG